jgi:hypothetical protein
MQIMSGFASRPASVGIAAKMYAPTIDKALSIQAAEDGSAVTSSDIEGAHVSFAPTPDGTGLSISEVLADRSTGGTVTVVPTVASPSK